MGGSSRTAARSVEGEPGCSAVWGKSSAEAPSLPPGADPRNGTFALVTGNHAARRPVGEHMKLLIVAVLGIGALTACGSSSDDGPALSGELTVVATTWNGWDPDFLADPCDQHDPDPRGRVDDVPVPR